MRKPVQQSFNFTPSETANMLYTQFYNYSDIMISEVFEGNKKRYPYSEL